MKFKQETTNKTKQKQNKHILELKHTIIKRNINNKKNNHEQYTLNLKQIYIYIYIYKYSAFKKPNNNKNKNKDEKPTKRTQTITYT